MISCRALSLEVSSIPCPSIYLESESVLSSRTRYPASNHGRRSCKSVELESGLELSADRADGEDESVNAEGAVEGAVEGVDEVVEAEEEDDEGEARLRCDGVERLGMSIGEDRVSAAKSSSGTSSTAGLVGVVDDAIWFEQI
jgi:hypothetical protein